MKSLPLFLRKRSMMMKTSRLELPPGPLRTAHHRLNELYVLTHPHQEAREAIERLFKAAGTSGRHKGLALIGSSGVGKTTAVRETERWLRKTMDLPEDAPTPLPVELITSDTSPKSLLSKVLHALGDPLFSSGTQHSMEARLERFAAHANVAGLALDEFHHVYAGKTQRQTLAITQTCKNIVNVFGKPIIVMGLDGVDAFIGSSPELTQRFRRKVFIEDPRATRAEDLADIKLLLKEVGRVLPCEEDCQLATPNMLARTLLAADCSFGSLVDLIRRACEFGAMEGVERVALRHYEAAHRESAPAARRKRADTPFTQPIQTVQALLTQFRPMVPGAGIQPT